MNKKTDNYEKGLNFSSIMRIMLLFSVGMNFLLLFSLWVIEARISKLESKHVDSTALKLNFGPN